MSTSPATSLLADRAAADSATVRPLLAVVAVVVLAGLDLAGAVLARRWMGTGAVWALLLGLATFALLFVVYALALSTADLAAVTLGWIVLLQAGVLLLQRSSGVPVAGTKVAAMVVCLALQAFVLLAPSR